MRSKGGLRTKGRLLASTLAGVASLVLVDATPTELDRDEEPVPIKPKREQGSLPEPAFAKKTVAKKVKRQRRKPLRLRQPLFATGNAIPAPIDDFVRIKRSRLIERFVDPPTSISAQAPAPVQDEISRDTDVRAAGLAAPGEPHDTLIVAVDRDRLTDIGASPLEAAAPAVSQKAALGDVASQSEFQDGSRKTAPAVETAFASVPPVPHPVPAPAPADVSASTVAPARVKRPILSLARLSQREYAPPKAPKASRPLALPEPNFGRNAPIASQPAKFASAIDRQGPASSVGTLGNLAGLSARNEVAVGTGVDFTAEDELILQVEANQSDPGETLIAYGTRAGTYLPLGALARLLEIGIAISDDGHYASGWLIDEKRTLVINLREGTAILAGKTVALAKGDAVAFEGELYLKADRIGTLLPLSVTVNTRAQSIAIKTLEPFPFELRQQREATREKLASRTGNRVVQTLPREVTPWAALTFPLTDVDARVVSDSALGTRTEADLRIAGDLAFMTARLFVSTSSLHGLTAARAEFGRQDPEGQLLGPLRATSFALGDVSTSSLPLGLRGASGRGVRLSNSSLAQASQFDKIDFRGELPSGNEVELYRNNTLIGSTRTPVNGQYEFLQVPVEFGLNVFRVVFYGPQGQRREEVRKLMVGDGRLGQGQFDYSFAIVQKDINLLGVRLPNFQPGPDYGHWRALMDLSYGISTALTLNGSAAWFQDDTGPRALVATGLRAALGGAALRLDAGFETPTAKLRLGRAFELGLGGKLAGFSFTLTHTEYAGDFSDEVRAFTPQLLSRATEATLAGTLDLRWLHRSMAFPLSGRFRRVAFSDGHIQTDGSLATSMRVPGAIVSSRLEYSSSAVPGTRTFQGLTGSFDLATLSRSRTRYHATLDFGLLPDVRLNAAGLDVDHAIDDATTIKAGIGRTFVGSQTTFGLSGYRQFRNFTLAFAGNYTAPSRAYAMQLRLGFAFGRNPITGRMFAARPGLAGQGALAVRAFEDSNGNRRFDDGERLIQGVTFGNGIQTGSTGSNGVALIGGLGDATRTSIRLDSNSLPDIAFAPINEGIELIPRAGRVHASDFAIVALSEIEGVAVFSGPGQDDRGVSGLTLLLCDAVSGRKVARVRTETDGFFYFEQIRPGRYKIELEPNQAQNLQILMKEIPEIDVISRSQVLRRNIIVKTK